VIVTVHAEPVSQKQLVTREPRLVIEQPTLRRQPAAEAGEASRSSRSRDGRG